MTKIITTHSGVKTEHEIDTKTGGFTCILHDQGLKVDVPEFKEVNPRDTLNCMKEMTQGQWGWISDSAPFKMLYALCFDADRRSGIPPIPKTIQELNDGDFGVIHICGLIVLGYEHAVINHNNVFYRNPETYLHPSSERMIVGMFEKILRMSVSSGGKVTATAENPEKVVKQKKKPKNHTAPVELKADNQENDKSMTLKWLNCHTQDKPFAKFGNKTFLVRELVEEVEKDTEIGKQLINLFVKKRDDNG